MFRLIGIGILGFSLFSCQPSLKKVHEQHLDSIRQVYPAYSITYDNISKNRDHAKSFSTTLLANPETNRMMLVLSWLNKNDTTLALEPGDFRLATADGGSAYPYGVEQLKPILPDRIGLYSFTFHLIHNRYFYRLSGMTGDLNPRYELFVNSNNTPIQQEYLLPAFDYQQYIMSHGSEAGTNLYHLDVNTIDQKLYQESLRLSDFVHAEEVELSLAGTNMRFHAYARDSNVYISLRVVNHSHHDIRLYPQQLLLQTPADTIQAKEAREMINLYPGERHFGQYTYHVKNIPEAFNLQQKAFRILLESQEVNLLKENIQFRTADPQRITSALRY